MNGPIDLIRIIYDNDTNKFEDVIDNPAILKDKEGLKSALNYALQNSTQKLYAVKLIETGVNLNEPDQNNQLPIMTLIKNIHKYPSERHYGAIIESMVAHHLNLNITDEADRTPLMEACTHKALPAIELFVKSGADINARNKKGETAFFRAAGSGSTDVMTQLKTLGADINMPNNNQQTPLMLSVNRFNQRTLEWLLENHANVNIKDMQGNTALMYAIASNRKDSVEALLKNGAQTNIINKFSHSPLQLAIRVKNKEIIDLLRKAEKRNTVRKIMYQKMKRENEHHI